MSVHAFHHGDHDPLLLGGVRPLVEDLRGRGLVDAFFFLRYWDGGPHVRVRLRASGDPRAVEDAALRALRAYLAEHPAPDSPLHGYAELAAEYARAEGLPSYLREPLPNNTVHAIAYRPEVRRYGDGPALAAVERHFAESSRIALGLIAAGTTRDQRHTAALAAFLLTSAAFAPTNAVTGGGLANGEAAWTANAVTGTPRQAGKVAGWWPVASNGTSEVAGWRPAASNGTSEAAGWRPAVSNGTSEAAGWWPAARGTGELAAFEAGYHAAREQVRAVAAEAERIATGTSRLPTGGSLTAWWRSMTALRDGLRAAGAGKRDARRIGDTCAHLLCNRLGLTLTDESYVRYLATRAARAAVEP